MVGKEIVCFYMIYWLIMLMVFDLFLFKKVFGYGWLLMKDGKMFKLKGNVVYFEMFVECYGLDVFCYYLFCVVLFGLDGVFILEDFVFCVNYDLVNDLGNLLNCMIVMINKYCDGFVFDYVLFVILFDSELFMMVVNVVGCYYDVMEKMEFNIVLVEIWVLIFCVNKYIDEIELWVLVKDEEKKVELNSVMIYLVEFLCIVVILF